MQQTYEGVYEAGTFKFSIESCNIKLF